MDISNYRCHQGITEYNFVLKHKHGLEKAAGFFPVNTQKKFDLSTYKGKFPVGVVLNGNYVIGWCRDTTPTNVFELEPHKSNPKHGYYWSARMPRNEDTYKEIIYRLNHRCVQLSAPDKTVFDRTSIPYFEDSRHILLLCVLETKCIPMERLIALEVKYMDAVAGDDIVTNCYRSHSLKYPTKTCLAEWITSQYKKARLTEDHDYQGLFDNVSTCVKEMLS